MNLPLRLRWLVVASCFRRSSTSSGTPFKVKLVGTEGSGCWLYRFATVQQHSPHRGGPALCPVCRVYALLRASLTAFAMRVAMPDTLLAHSLRLIPLCKAAFKPLRGPLLSTPCMLHHTGAHALDR